MSVNINQHIGAETLPNFPASRRLRAILDLRRRADVRVRPPTFAYVRCNRYTFTIVTVRQEFFVPY